MLETATFHESLIISNGSVIILLSILTAATWIDLNYHRIPNALSLGGIVFGVALHGWISGFPGIATGLGGAAIGIGLFLPFYLLKGMGAGDVKLMGAVGAFLGPQNALLATGLTLVAGGIMAIVILLVRGGLISLLKRFFATIKCFLVYHKIVHPPPQAGDVAVNKFPYAAAIGLGTLATLLW